MQLTYEFQYDVLAAFAPTRTPVPYGVVPELTVSGTPLAADLQVPIPGFTPTRLRSFKALPGEPVGIADVVGVTDSLYWSGRAGDSISVSFMVSPQNAALLRSVTGTAVDRLDWWTAGFDGRQWFDQAYPERPVAAVVATRGGVRALAVAPTAIRLSTSIPELYPVELQILPPPGVIATVFRANSRTDRQASRWGGTTA